MIGASPRGSRHACSLAADDGRLEGIRMLRMDERVAYVEGLVSEQSAGLRELREALRHLEQRMETRFEAVDRRLDALDSRVSRQFTWIVGIQVTTLVAVAGALLARA
jgi:hypothetical protein